MAEPQDKTPTVVRGGHYPSWARAAPLWSNRGDGSSAPAAFLDGRHVPALQPPPQRPFHPGDRTIHHRLEGGSSLLVEHARQTAEDHLDPADVIDAAPRAIHVLQTNADALNRGRELSQPQAELPPDIGPVIRTQLDSAGSDVGGDQWGVDADGLPLHRSGYPIREWGSFPAVRGGGASLGSPRGAAAKFFEYVGGCYDAYQPTPVHHRQAADRLSSHQAGRSAQGRLRGRAHHGRAHQVADQALPANRAAAAAAEILVGHDTYDARVLRNYQVADAAPSHP